MLKFENFAMYAGFTSKHFQDEVVTNKRNIVPMSLAHTKGSSISTKYLKSTVPFPSQLTFVLFQHPNRREVFLLHVDGRLHHEDADIFIQLLSTTFSVPNWLVLTNNERMCIPLDVGVVWELEDLSSLTPAVVSKLALQGFSNSGKFSEVFNCFPKKKIFFGSFLSKYCYGLFLLLKFFLKHFPGLCIDLFIDSLQRMEHFQHTNQK